MKKHLVIAGHGKQPSGRIDYGAEGNGYKENNLTKELCTLMDAYAGEELTFITDHDVYGYRTMGIHTGWDSITEIHFNAFNTAAYGCEVLIHADFEPDALDKKLLAVLDTYFVSRGFKKRSDLYNMNVCKQKGFNYRLVEVCFIDNANDMKVYQANKKAIAMGLVEAITGKVQTPAEPATDATGSLYRVQVGAYKTKGNADKMKEKLKTAGFDAVVVKG